MEPLIIYQNRSIKRHFFAFTKQALQHWHLEKQAALLQRENEKYRRYLETIFRSVSDAIITIDTDMKIVHLNETADQWLREKGAEGISDLNNLPPEISLACLNDAREVLQQGIEVRKHLIECITPDNKIKVISLNASPLRGEDEEFQGVVIVARDMTTEKPQRLRRNPKLFSWLISAQAMQCRKCISLLKI